MLWRSNAGSKHFRLYSVVSKYFNNISNEVHAIVSNIIKSSPQTDWSNVAPAFAASIALVGGKTRVTFVRIPSWEGQKPLEFHLVSWEFFTKHLVPMWRYLVLLPPFCCFCRNNFGAHWSGNDFTNFLNTGFKIDSFFGNECWIGGDSIYNSPSGILFIWAISAVSRKIFISFWKKIVFILIILFLLPNGFSSF